MSSDEYDIDSEPEGWEVGDEWVDNPLASHRGKFKRTGQTKEERMLGVFSQTRDTYHVSRKGKRLRHETTLRAQEPLFAAFKSAGVQKTEDEQKEITLDPPPPKRVKPSPPPEENDDGDLFGIGSMVGLGLPMGFGKSSKSRHDKWAKSMYEDKELKPKINTDKKGPDWAASSNAMRMMQKMAPGWKFGKGLGTKEQGIKNHIKSWKRPRNAGLGVVQEKHPELVKEEKQSKRKQELEELKRQRQEERAARWKKGNRKKPEKKQKKEYVLADEIPEKKKEPMKIIDMTGPTQRVVHADQLETEQLEEEVPKFCPAFLKNLRQVIDSQEVKMHDYSRQIRDLKLRVNSCQSRLADAQRNSTTGGDAAQRLQSILDIIDEMVPEATSEEAYMNDRPGKLWTSPSNAFGLSQKFRQLQQYRREYVQYGLVNLAVKLLMPKLEQQFLRWEPFKAPSLAAVAFNTWQQVLSSDSSSNDLYSMMLERIVIPRLIHSIRNQWNPQNPNQCMELLEGSRPILPPSLFFELIVNQVIEKLRETVNMYEPYGNFMNMDIWILPWHAYLGNMADFPFEKWTVMRGFVRRKISRCLQFWRVGDPAAMNWVGPFMKAGFWVEDDLIHLFNEISPKLEQALKNCHKKRKDNVDLFVEVQKWEPLISPEQYEGMLQRGFFPIWLRDLRRWLSEPNVDCGQLKSWYDGWKSAFSKEMQVREVVKEHFMAALDMISWKLDGCGDIPKLEVIFDNLNLEIKTPLPDDMIRTATRNIKRKKRITSNGPIEYSFIEIVGVFAERNGFPFSQQIGRKDIALRTDGYTFGRVTCYFEGKCAFAKMDDGEFEPVNLAELLGLAKRRKKGHTV